MPDLCWKRKPRPSAHHKQAQLNRLLAQLTPALPTGSTDTPLSQLIPSFYLTLRRNSKCSTTAYGWFYKWFLNRIKSIHVFKLGPRSEVKQIQQQCRSGCFPCVFQIPLKKNQLLKFGRINFLSKSFFQRNVRYCIKKDTCQVDEVDISTY